MLFGGVFLRCKMNVVFFSLRKKTAAFHCFSLNKPFLHIQSFGKMCYSNFQLAFIFIFNINVYSQRHCSHRECIPRSAVCGEGKKKKKKRVYYCWIMARSYAGMV